MGTLIESEAGLEVESANSSRLTSEQRLTLERMFSMVVRYGLSGFSGPGEMMISELRRSGYLDVASLNLVL